MTYATPVPSAAQRAQAVLSSLTKANEIRTKIPGSPLQSNESKGQTRHLALFRTFYFLTCADREPSIRASICLLSRTSHPTPRQRANRGPATRPAVRGMAAWPALSVLDFRHYTSRVDSTYPKEIPANRRRGRADRSRRREKAERARKMKKPAAGPRRRALQVAREVQTTALNLTVLDGRSTRTTVPTEWDLSIQERRTSAIDHLALGSTTDIH